MMTSEHFESKMQFGRKLGFSIPSASLVWSYGIIGTYKHAMGVRIKEEFAHDPVLLAIAEELYALQGRSRLMIGKFFYASLNVLGSGQGAELFYDNQFEGQDHLKELHPLFLAILSRFTAWLQDASN